ncbi:MAG: phosphodiester glycosidase family protein [Candidatus Carbobacillus altaicus]|nr:phosphodiester glycosidase family protein [Candidatus Carbobacillus altaicus]
MSTSLPLRTRPPKKRWWESRWLRRLSFLSLVLMAALLWFFMLGPGLEYRRMAAEMILSSQHRQWAWITFLSPQELQSIDDNIARPAFKNVFPDDDRNHSALDHTALDGSFEPPDPAVPVTETPAKKLIITLESISAYYGPDHYFRGKILTVPDPSVIKMVTSKNPHRGEQIHVLAEQAGAIAAVNANGFHDPEGHGNGGIPLGIIIADGKIVNTPFGGADVPDYISGLTQDGRLITGVYSANKLIKMGVMHAGGFKPQLIVNGEKMITKGDGGWGIGPRAAIAQRKDGSILFVVIEGRQVQSLGATLKDVQDLLYERGAVQAMALDGGSSAIMYVDGQTVTIPSSKGHVSRYLPNAWVVVVPEDRDYDIVVTD